MAEHLAGHIPCAAQRHHMCSKPSGRKCVDCGAPAGTVWGPYWCMDCDSRRLDRIRAGFEEISRQLAESGDTNG